ncbi:hypothetical protein [Flavobacterium piscisymbiosum]|uniref:DUF2262 domain-containing protein n=1 Tax=Flavobacterium piscisymbiosum TaxID=2893753 RepID=A0ABS8M9J0_9FLAO|nr:hypothetical protein [Flavobacterium sp. F-30]MCC9062104.1 hypothetical protein [Flavobacterium sp. F-30]
MKTLQIDSQKFDFVYSESAKCYMSTQYVNDIDVSFEIYEDEYNQSQINWDLFVDFVKNLKNKNSLPELLTKSQKVLLALAEAFGSSIDQDEKIEDYHMVFSGLQFKGSIANHFSDGYYSFSLWFNIEKKINGYSVDPYGGFITDIEGSFIVGAKRIQC